MSQRAVQAFDRVIADGGVVLFPSDTVYGLACEATNPEAIERLYALKDRAPEKAAALMFFNLDDALVALPELGPRTRDALRRLLPGPITTLLPNPAHRFPLASRDDPAVLGLRVVCVPALSDAHGPVLQSSANPSGEAAVANLTSVAEPIKAGADLVIDGGVELFGVASTVLDLTAYEHDGEWRIVREGAASQRLIESLLNATYVFEPDKYDDDVVEELHDYDELQARLVRACLDGARPVARILELGTGTGNSAGLLLEAFRDVTLVGLDGTPAMLAQATTVLDPDRFRPRLGLLEEPLPAGEFDLVASALAVHHLDGDAKRRLFARVHQALADGGRFVLADVIVPEDPADARIDLEPGFDQPSLLVELVGWLQETGFRSVDVVWRRADLAVIVADR